MSVLLFQSTAAELFAGGNLLEFPTKTVYGLGVDAKTGVAIAGID